MILLFFQNVKNSIKDKRHPKFWKFIHPLLPKKCAFRPRKENKFDLSISWKGLTTFSFNFRARWVSLANTFFNSPTVHTSWMMRRFVRISKQKICLKTEYRCLHNKKDCLYQWCFQKSSQVQVGKQHMWTQYSIVLTEPSVSWVGTQKSFQIHFCEWSPAWISPAFFVSPHS
jgi:hypothetical protein